ncbi:MAG: penicillin-binding protein [Nitrospina sp.]|nr:penicillin-binding protein [Nitrospina sp.]
MKNIVGIAGKAGWSVSLLLVSIMAIFMTGYFYLEEDLPQLPQNLSYINYRHPTEIYSSDGEVIKTLGLKNTVRLDMISQEFQNAILATEDSRFFNHHGIDPIAFLRAMIVNFKRGRLVQGGSTITQQLAKNLFFSFDKSWIRKFKELLMAFQIETSFPKSAILEAYSNLVYFGNGAYGVDEASRVYFGKRAKDLTLLQAAMLAGSIRSPNKFNPFNDRVLAMRRAKTVLARMVHEGFIDKHQKGHALNSDLGLIKRRTKYNNNHYFVDAVVEELNSIYGPELVNSGGLRIFTTLDSKLQKSSEEAALHHLKFLDKKLVQRGKNLQAAVVSIDNKSGAVRVMIGGTSYEKSQFNRALSTNRMVGSSFKPVVYMSAMQNLGYHPGTVLVDEPMLFELPHNKKWEPANYNDEYMGPVVLKKALAKSLNVISAKLIFKVQPKKVVQTARKFGFTSPLRENYSLALGATGASPLELASAYSVIANLGEYRDPFYVSKIEDYQGNVLYEHFIEGEKRFEPDEIYPLLDMMQGVMDDGSGRVIRRMGFKHPAAGKTGTTNAFRDAWFTGFTRGLTTSVWVGYDDNESMYRPNEKGVTGSHAAAPIWGLIMGKSLKDSEKMTFPVPRKIRFEHANISDGYYEQKKSKTTVRIALSTGKALPRRPAHVVTRKFQSDMEVTTTQRNAAALPIEASEPLRFKHSLPKLDSIIWFMLNLENASMGKLNKIPTRWFVQMLKDTRDVETSFSTRLIKGRKVLIEKLLSRIGSFDDEMIERIRVESILRPSEIKDFKVQSVANN